jgi:dCTP diphosphatase
VEEEMADVLLYLVRLADRLDVDLVQAARRKLEANAEKYPVEKSRGRANSLWATPISAGRLTYSEKRA